MVEKRKDELDQMKEILDNHYRTMESLERVKNNRKWTYIK